MVWLIGMIMVWASCEHVIEANSTEPQPLPPCDTEFVHFDNEIQPIITSNCAIPGCHDNLTPAGLIDLTNYDAMFASRVRGGPLIIPGNSTNSPLFRAVRGWDLVFMPPLYNHQLTGAEKNLIGRWIREGAQRTAPCVDTRCDTSQYDWSNTIRPIIQTYCAGCHYADFPLAGINLDFHSQVQDQALNGLLLESIEGTAPARLMPLDKPLPDCKIIQIKKWIANGAPQD
jgi:uncharacterized membrane protein